VPSLNTRALSFLLLGLLLPGEARAQTPEEPTQQCIAAHVEAQRLRKSSKLQAARKALVRCADPSCPAVLVQECTALLSEADKAQPSLVFVARDEAGLDIADARVLEAGTVLLDRLDGKAIEIDPGEHKLRLERTGSEPIEQTLIVREGDKLRRVEVVFTTKVAVQSEPPEREISPAFWIVGGAGIVGLSLFGGLGIAGLSKKGALDDLGCAPRCATEDVDEARTLFLAADVSLGVGLAALAVAPVLFFTSPFVASSSAAQLSLAPIATRETVGLVVVGDF
jgi:hypothetical protein